MSINIAQFSSVIEKYLQRLGKSVKLYSGNREYCYSAVIENTWKRDKTRFEGTFSHLGEINNDYCEYFGPADVDITALGKDDYLHCDGRKYVFVKTERVSVGEYLLYYTGMLKLVREEDGDVFR